jgi:beta-galactosidase
MSTFTKRNGQFYWDDQEFHLLSGAIHYFRVPREYWRDRLEKLLAQGCNTVETYLPWNLHEPQPGHFDFSGNLDVVAFLNLAADMGLKAIVRPSPYTCGEFEFGGQPWWLLKDPQMRVRTLEAGYREAVRRYYADLLPRLAPLQCTHGGPILACQIENEYGYYGNDTNYLEFLKEQLMIGGIEVMFFTTDGPWGMSLEAGSLPGVLAGGSFGSRAPEHFKKMKRLRPADPLFCSEFWMGWFDAWGDEHHVRDADAAASSLDEILAEGHVNLYMFHGGTNFGFTSGSNHYAVLKADVTSYDYDAPLSEAGDLTPKFHAFRQVIARRTRDEEVRRRLSEPVDPSRFSTIIHKEALGTWPVTATASLADSLKGISIGKTGPRPLSMEELDQGYGYVLYRLTLPGPQVLNPVSLWKCNDRATIFVNGRFALAQVGNEVGCPFPLTLDRAENSIEILVENQGRVNFGERMNDQRKGISGAILIDKHAHGPVESWGLGFDSVPAVHWAPSGLEPGTPGFHRVPFRVSVPRGEYVDTFLSLPGWGKGVAWVNGHPLGRFWQIGPQQTLYVPGPYLKDGDNELVIFETEGQAGSSVSFVATPVLNSTRK